MSKDFNNYQSNQNKSNASSRPTKKDNVSKLNSTQATSDRQAKEKQDMEGHNNIVVETKSTMSKKLTISVSGRQVEANREGFKQSRSSQTSSSSSTSNESTQASSTIKCVVASHSDDINTSTTRAEGDKKENQQQQQQQRAINADQARELVDFNFKRVPKEAKPKNSGFDGKEFCGVKLEKTSEKPEPASIVKLNGEEDLDDDDDDDDDEDEDMNKGREKIANQKQELNVDYEDQNQRRSKGEDRDHLSNHQDHEKSKNEQQEKEEEEKEKQQHLAIRRKQSRILKLNCFNDQSMKEDLSMNKFNSRQVTKANNQFAPTATSLFAHVDKVKLELTQIMAKTSGERHYQHLNLPDTYSNNNLSAYILSEDVYSSYQNQLQNQVAAMHHHQHYLQQASTRDRRMSSSLRSDGGSTSSLTPQLSKSEEEEREEIFQLASMQDSRFTNNSSYLLDQHNYSPFYNDDYINNHLGGIIEARKQQDKAEALITLQQLMRKRDELKNMDRQLFNMMKQYIVKLESSQHSMIEQTSPILNQWKPIESPSTLNSNTQTSSSFQDHRQITCCRQQQQQQQAYSQANTFTSCLPQQTVSTQQASGSPATTTTTTIQTPIDLSPNRLAPISCLQNVTKQPIVLSEASKISSQSDCPPFQRSAVGTSVNLKKSRLLSSLSQPTTATTASSSIDNDAPSTTILATPTPLEEPQSKRFCSDINQDDVNRQQFTICSAPVICDGTTMKSRICNLFNTAAAAYMQQPLSQNHQQLLNNHNHHQLLQQPIDNNQVLSPSYTSFSQQQQQLQQQQQQQTNPTNDNNQQQQIPYDAYGYISIPIRQSVTSSQANAAAAAAAAAAAVAAVHKSSTFRCHVCGSGFEDRHRLQQHLSIHLNLHPSWFEEMTIKETMAQYEAKRGDYLCQACNLRFETTAEFDKHMQLHGDKPHRCDLCDQDNKFISFRYYRQLLTHLRSHCFLYSCKFAPECKQTANRKDYLKLHILKHHLNNQLPEQHTICCQ